ncbi:MAG: TonB-dependent receptor [Cyclobacteriaceae bacterium]|nr:TonB-dependent receptor [Cyclobacteriaceae bacterium HetDA_MAG_MS6]
MSKYALYSIVLQSSFYSFAVSFDTEAQSKKLEDISLKIEAKSAELIDVFTMIQEGTDFTFSYRSGDLPASSITLKKGNNTMRSVLEDISSQSKVTFRRVNNTIHVKPAEAGEPVVEEVFTRAQEIRVTGKVTDEEGEPLPGATVLEKGTTNGTITDIDGGYALSISDVNATLTFSFVGYKTIEVGVGGRSVVDASMPLDISALQEVVVIGYGTQRKSDLTGSVGSISEDQVRAVPILSVDQSLQGRVAGVQVTQANAQPGGAVSVRVRGGNSITAGNEPLYVVDGFIGAGDLNSINPNDIASIEILKDASATAIYGARGANGVVLITTKNGKSGKMQISLDVYRGVQEVRNTLDLLNATEYAELANEVSNLNGGGDVFANPSSLGSGTDWQDELFRTAPMENYQISFSGGKENIQYLFSANYFNQDGIVENTGFDRLSVRNNLNAKLNDKLTFGSSLTLSRTSRTRINNEDNAADGSGIITNALVFSPTQPADALVNDDFGVEAGNPVLYQKRVTDDINVSRALGNMFLEYEIIKGLKIKTSFGADVISEKRNLFIPQSTFEGAAAGGIAEVGVTESINWLNENIITYSTSLGSDHELSVLGGITAQHFESESISGSSRDFANDVLEYNNLVAGQNTNVGSGANEWALLSYLFRTNYILKGKYLFTVTGRYDGSSRFGSGNKYAFFPSAAVGWRVIDEPFMSDVPLLSELKLRASYGLTGSQEIGTFRSLAALSNDLLAFGDNVTVGYFANRFENPNLKWETTRQLDIGLDVGLFDSRVNITADYYYKRTEDLLLNSQLPAITGIPGGRVLLNTGELENEGFEFSVSTVNTTGELSWETSFNIATNRQEILDLGDDEEIALGDLAGFYKVGTPGILRVGEPLGSFFGFKTDGILQNAAEVAASGMDPVTTQPGDRRLVDTDGDGDVDADDRVILGQAAPKVFGGITNTFNYKGFDLSIFFQWVSGNSILNLQRTILENPTGEPNQLDVVADRWTGEGTSNSVPRAGAANIDQVTDVFVEDGSYVRMRNITLGYDLKKSIIKTDAIGKARIYISGNNLLTITDYKGFDPEVNVFGGNNERAGIDFGSYPMARTILAGINLTF